MNVVTCNPLFFYRKYFQLTGAFIVDADITSES